MLDQTTSKDILRLLLSVFADNYLSHCIFANKFD